MKKFLFLALAFLMFGFVTGCDVKDLVDVEVDVTESAEFPLTGGTSRFSEDIDLTDETDYSDYKDYIEDVDIAAMRYRVTENTGDGGALTFYVTDLGAAFDHASKQAITEPITIVAGTTTPDWTNITWNATGKAHFEDKLFNEKKLTIWADIIADPPSGTINALIVTEFDIKIEANPF
jgi:hypothetical protein